MAAPSSDVKSAFHALNECGLPLSICIHLQMCVKNALWTARQTNHWFFSHGLLGCLLITKEIIIKGGENHVKKKKPSSPNYSLGTDGVTVPRGLCHPTL